MKNPNHDCPEEMKSLLALENIDEEEDDHLDETIIEHFSDGFENNDNEKGNGQLNNNRKKTPLVIVGILCSFIVVDHTLTVIAGAALQGGS